MIFKRYFLKILLLAISSSVFSQNIIENGDFEVADPLFPVTWSGGGGFSTVVQATPWEDNFSTGIAHSPDRFKSCVNQPVYLRDGSPTAPYIIGSDGCGFVGMFENEIFEQEVNGEKNDPYTLTFSFRLVADPYRIDVSNNIGPRPATLPFKYSISEAVSLNVLVAKNKIEYEFSVGNSKKMDNGQEIEIAKMVDMVAAAYPLGEWNQVTFPVSSSFDFNWIGFEVIGDGYVLIDGISLTKIAGGCEVCELASCGPYDGCIDITVGNIHGVSNPGFVWWGIGHMDEVRKVRIKLSNSAGQHFRTIEVNYPGDTWKFDGRDNGGNELPAGGYTYEITCWNDCGTRKIEGTFIKANDFGVSTPNPNIFVPSYVPPEPCCEDFIFINNNNVPNGGPLVINSDIEIKAKKGVYVANVNVIGVDFISVVEIGGEIYIDPTVKLIGSSAHTIDIYVEDCPPEIVGDVIDSRNNDIGISIDDEKGFSIWPNPSSGDFKIVMPIDIVGDVSFKIINLNGSIVRNGKINAGATAFGITGLSQGTYLVQVKGGQYNFQQNIVVF